MINLLRNIFYKKQEQSYIYNRNEENSIAFVLDKDGNLVIQINIQHFEDNMHIEKFAELLFMLNGGFYQKNIVEILTEMKVQDKDRELFLGKVIQKWSHYAEKYLDLEEKVNDYNMSKPCVSPLNFSKMVLQNNKTQ